MNKQEHLLTIFQEELLEVAKELSKIKRFGVHGMELNSQSALTNLQKLEQEWNDLLAVLEMIEEEGIFFLYRDDNKIAKKKEKVREFLEHSRMVGTLS